jgi:hypothetical protein
MASATYRLFREAMLRQKQVVCRYQGYLRELCPIIIGHKDSEEKLLAYQFAGGSKSGLPREGAWKCLYLSEVRNAELRDGPWREGRQHRKQQTCVEGIDLDVNIHVRRRR